MGFVIEIRSDPRLNLEVQMVSRQHPLRYTYTQHTGSRLGWHHQPDHTTIECSHITSWYGKATGERSRRRERERARRLVGSAGRRSAFLKKARVTGGNYWPLEADSTPYTV